MKALSRRKSKICKEIAARRSKDFLDLIHQGRLEASKIEIEKIKSELGIEIDGVLAKRIDYFYYNNFGLKIGEIYNVLSFVKEVYVSLYGSSDGIEGFIRQRSELLDTSYSYIVYRLAIFSHFGLLEDAFLNYTILITSSFTMVSTKDFYRLFSLGAISNIDEFKNLAIKISPDELKRLRRACKVDKELLLELNQEMRENLNRIRNKSIFMYMLKNKKESR